MPAEGSAPSNNTRIWIRHNGHLFNWVLVVCAAMQLLIYQTGLNCMFSGA